MAALVAMLHLVLLRELWPHTPRAELAGPLVWRLARKWL